MMNKMDLIGSIGRAMRPFGYNMTRTSCGRYMKVWPESLDMSCASYVFLYDDLKTALQAWHWVRNVRAG
jgi:hypothetical protein